jgi:glycosyltransferase involved in cell wall biosynthesis
VRKARVDIFHANLRHPWSCQYGLVAAAVRPRMRIVAVEHALVSAASPLQRRLRQLLGGWIDCEVSVAEGPARKIEELVGYPPGTVRVVNNPVADNVADPAPRISEGPVVGAVARLSVEKGIDLLIRALPELPGVDVLLVGDGPERPALELLAHELHVAERVHFLGWRDDVASLLHSIDVLALPSRSEGAPLVVAEAGLCRVPVVAARVGGVPEVVLDGENGLLVPPEDPHALARAIGSLVGDPELRARMGARGREIALERYSPAATARSFEAIYRELVDG